jgi:hypothetical protein
MGDAAVAALVAGGVSLIVTFGKIAWDARQSSHNERLAARERLDKYRAPFLAAVDDLGRRVNNVRNDSFLAYLDMESRREITLLSTLFRLAQYLGWAEVVYGYADRLRFETDQETRSVAATLGDISWILAADEFDRTDERDFTTSQLMLWREEQRAVGELMRQEGDEARCISFNSFVTNYETCFSRWFAAFASQITFPCANKADRLAELHRVLTRLIQQLDVDKVLVELDSDGKVIKPLWAQPTNLSKPTRHTLRTGSV